jgi:hypothetical protein
MKEKAFRLRGDQIREIAPRRGACIASDEITVGGKRVGYMYREEPGNEVDSGWRFFSGSESQDFVDDPENLAFYDVNTIANYDPEIVAMLDSAVGAAFERDASGGFVAIEFPCEPDDSA